MGGPLHLVQREGTGRGRSPPRPFLAVPNVTAYPSTAGVPITVLVYDGPLLCGFNVAIKGLILDLSVDNSWQHHDNVQPAFTPGVYFTVNSCASSDAKVEQEAVC